MITPLPSASPSALITRGNRASSTKANAASHSEKAAPRAVGILFLRIKFFRENFRGLQARRGFRRAKNAQPLGLEKIRDAGRQRIIRSRSPLVRFRFPSRNGPTPADRSPGIATFSPTSAVPAFPGAQKIRSARGDCFNFQASACSRPPLPTTRIFTAVRFLGGTYPPKSS